MLSRLPAGALKNVSSVVGARANIAANAARSGSVCAIPLVLLVGRVLQLTPAAIPACTLCVLEFDGRVCVRGMFCII